MVFDVFCFVFNFKQSLFSSFFTFKWESEKGLYSYPLNVTP